MTGYTDSEFRDIQRRALHRTPGTGFFVGLAIIGLALFALVWQGRHTYSVTHALPSIARTTPPLAPPAAGATAPAEPAVVPLPVADGEALIHDLARGLTADSHLLRWADHSDFLRRWVAGTQLFADGDSPQPVLGFMRPGDRFAASEKDGKLVPTSRTEHRYDIVVGALAAIDPIQAAQVYDRLRPYAQSAYGEIGDRRKSFDQVLKNALTTVLTTPVPDEQLELRLRGAVYEYADPKWQSLTAAQKALLRLGPDNVRTMQDWAKRFLQVMPSSGI